MPPLQDFTFPPVCFSLPLFLSIRVSSFFYFENKKHIIYSLRVTIYKLVEKLKYTESPSLGGEKVLNMNVNTVQYAEDDARGDKTVQAQGGDVC